MSSIFLIEPDTQVFGARSESNDQLRTHFAVLKARLTAQKLANYLEPTQIENTDDLRQAILATAIRLTIRSVALKEDETTLHHRRALTVYPHRHYRISSTKPLPIAGHLGSLGYAALKHKLTGTPEHIIRSAIDLFWQDHGVPPLPPRGRWLHLLEGLGYLNLKPYIDSLEEILTSAVSKQHPLLTRYRYTTASVSNLGDRLLMGEFDPNLPFVLEVFQTVSDTFGGNLPFRDPIQINSLILKTLTLGYSAGMALIYQVMAIEALLHVHDLLPESQPLEEVSNPLAIAQHFATASDCFTKLAQFQTVEYAYDYAHQFQRMSQAWLSRSNQAVLEGSQPYRILDEPITNSVPALFTTILPPVRAGGHTLLMSADQYVVAGQLDLTVTLVGTSPKRVSISPQGPVSFQPVNVLLKPGESKQIPLLLSGAGNGVAIATTQDGLRSNTLLFENIPLNLKP